MRTIDPAPSAHKGIKKTTPFPNRLLDEIMPLLKDTEWRLLCVVVRQTLGHYDHATKSRKAHDWLTQSQLLSKTGRNSAAVSAAINGLVSKGYIQVETASGRVLTLAKERRQAKGQLLYGLPRDLIEWLAKGESGGKARKANSEIQFAPYSQIGPSHAKSTFPDVENANTTKEIFTKETIGETGVALQPDVASGHQLVDLGLSDQASEFCNLFTETALRFNRRPDKGLSADDAARLQDLVSNCPTYNWKGSLERFFTSELNYVRSHNYSLKSFLNTSNIFRIRKSPTLSALMPT